VIFQPGMYAVPEQLPTAPRKLSKVVCVCVCVPVCVYVCFTIKETEIYDGKGAASVFPTWPELKVSNIIFL
jgi:hypothetical protein